MVNLNNDIHLFNEDAIKLYSQWESPTVIISDGPYGIKGFPGDLKTEDGLVQWYEPHIKEWTANSSPKTTLWFWCTEQGWATVHPILTKYGWEFKACNIWDKGLGHIAGNVNTKTLSRLPVVTEVCIQYVKRPLFYSNGQTLDMKNWLRAEWKRTGLPFHKTNEACGVADAATRKYFSLDPSMWYMPPADKFAMIVEYANLNGNPQNKPYFTVDGKKTLTKEEWENYRPIFKCPIGVTNVWQHPQLRTQERIKDGNKAVHLNQKPLLLIERIIEWSSNIEDVVWDPFGGLFTTAIACHNLKRRCYSAEITSSVYEIGKCRVKGHLRIE